MQVVMRNSLSMHYKNNNLILFFLFLSVYACSSPGINASPKPGSGLSADLQLINKYSSDYFVGLGKGVAPSENVAMKIARASALGELSSNVKVFISSKLEVYASESSSGESDESSSQKIVEIGNATIRSPEYEIISSIQNASNSNFEVKLLAKKLKSEHFEEATKSLNINDDERLLNFLLEDEN
jgi:hypothetical protein